LGVPQKCPTTIGYLKNARNATALHSAYFSAVRVADITSGLSAKRRFHSSFNPQTINISRDCGDGEYASSQFVRDGTIPRFQVSIDFDGVPFFRVTNILDGEVVVLAPKERHGIESFTIPKNISCGGLSLTLAAQFYQMIVDR
jgi:hypothetical protein